MAAEDVHVNETSIAKRAKTSFQHIADVIETLADALHILVDETRKNFQLEESLDKFVATHLGRLGKAIGLHYTALKELSVTSWKDFEALIKEDYKQSVVSESYEELILAEDKWNNLLSDIEVKNRAKEGTSARTNCNIGSSVPMDEKFVCISDRKLVSLRDLCNGSKSLLLIILRHLA